MEKPTEIQLVIISDDFRDFIDGIGCCFKYHLSIVDSDSNDELHWCGTGVFFEIPDKPADTHSS